MKKVLFSLLAALCVMTACEDEFTEKDLLEAQQSVAYTVELVDITAANFDSTANLEGITVQLVQGGQTLSAVTDTEGFAMFPQVKLGTVNIRIEDENYYRVKGTSTLSAEGRIGQLSTTINMVPKNGKNVATVEGIATIETDVTNEEREFVPQGTEISFALSDNYEPIVATVGAEGKYSVNLPASKDGLWYEINLPVLNLDQKIAVNYVEGDQEALARIETIQTVFAPNRGAAYIPEVNPISFVLNGKVVGFGYANNNGQIYINYYGNTVTDTEGGFEPSSSLAVEVKDLTGSGSGAVVKAYTDTEGYINYFDVEDGGEGYRNNVNWNSSRRASYNDELVIYAGVAEGNNIDFGTGTSRSVEID
jgi:hypothetical protein